MVLIPFINNKAESGVGWFSFNFLSKIMPLILEAKKIREKREVFLKEKLSFLFEKHKKRPLLVIFQIGDRPESNLYIKNKIVFGQKIGVDVELKKFPEDINENELKEEIKKANSYEKVSAIIVQLPIPLSLNKDSIINTISPDKDADGLTDKNISLLESGDSNAICPATARGVMELIEEYGIDVDGKDATVIGRSNLVGRPIATLLKQKGARVSVCHRSTPDITPFTKKADILVVATGNPNLIDQRHVKKDQIIIDVGLTVQELEGKRVLKGDVDFRSVFETVKSITPVPGGIGLMTVLALFENIFDIFKKRIDS